MTKSALDVVNDLAGQGRSHFHASHVAKQLGIATQDAYKMLDDLREQKLVDVHFEVICPETYRTIKSYELGEKIPYGEMFEERTGDCEPFELTEDDMLVTYSPSRDLLLSLNRKDPVGSKKKRSLFRRMWTTFSAAPRFTKSIRSRIRSSKTSMSSSTAPARRSRRPKVIAQR